MLPRSQALSAALLSLLSFVAPVSVVQAQELQPHLPQTRMVLTMNQDFVGKDLAQMFDTNFDACRRACEADKACVAFTFNSKSKACFPKSEIHAEEFFDGAQSGEIIRTDVLKQVRGFERSAEIGFVGSRSLGDARKLAYRIGWTHPAGQYSVKDMVQASRDRSAEGDKLNAMRWMGGAVTKSDAADQWIEYARLLTEVAPTAGNRKAEYTRRSLNAAINGYLRADSVPVRVNALTAMADALRANKRGRDMIPALRLANELQPRDDIAEALDDAIAKFGFRISDHKVESDLANPRICATFSEPLVKAGVDYSDYVKLPDQSMSVEATGNQLCLRGGAHGERYLVTFRQGMPARSGEKLIKDVDLRFYIRDRQPLIRFPGRAYVLPAAGDAALPVETVNLDQLDLRLARVTDRNLLRTIQQSYFGRPIYRYETELFENELSEEVWTGLAEVQNDLNQTMTTRLPLGEVLAGLEPGAYALRADVPGGDRNTQPAVQWFILTDLGLTTMSGSDGLHVFLRGLGDAQARAGVTLDLISNANRVLDSVTTDDRGYARFDPGLLRGKAGASPALITARDGDDLAFLSLRDPAFDLSDRGVEGREPSPPIDLFLTTDRGAYRAGEVIHVTALARDNQARAIDGLPVTAILTRPDGVEYARMTSNRDAAGGHVFALPLGQTVPRGNWRIEVKSDLDAPALASQKVLVEDFLPERIKVDLTLPKGPLTLTDLPRLEVQTDYLFGAPAAGMKIEADLRLNASRRIDGQAGYVFGRHDADHFSRANYVTGTSDQNGWDDLGLSFTLPNENRGTGFRMSAVVRVSEASGRPVERRITRNIGPAGPVIGIKPEFDGQVPEGTEAAFKLIVLDAALQSHALDVEWRVNRVETRYQWYQQHGSWKWERFTARSEVARGQAQLNGTPTDISVPVEWGRYEIIVESTGGDYVATSHGFSAGWFAPADASTTPDMLELSLDRDGYKNGDTAKLRLVPRSAGTALITVVSNRLIDMKAVEVTKGENIIDLAVTDKWGAGAYVTASVIRPMEVEAGQMPARALGLSYAPVDPGDKALTVDILTAPQADPRGRLTAQIKLANVAPGDTAYATVAAVDLGILNLTGFKTPDPQGHYFGQRRLGMDIRDLYGRLIDSTQGAMGQVRSGGDGGGASSLQSPPPTEELLAYFTGPVTIGPDGLAEVQFDLPEFNGTVRLMAVAWTDRSIGAAKADVLVRDPVVVTASLPRFLAPGDTSSMLLEVVHATGPTGDMALNLTANGVTMTGDYPQTLTLTDQGKATFRVPLRADEVGDHGITIALTTPDGKRLTKSLNLPVRSNDPEVAVTRRFALDQGDTFTLDSNVFTGLRPGTGEAIVSAGPLARLDAPALLATLNRYPYGCTEQVTSQAMPLLYLSSVAETMGLADQIKVTAKIDRAIARVLTRQAASGSFGLWNVGSGDFWLDAYVTDFLSRAQAQGHVIPERAFRTALDNLRNRINYAPDFDARTNGGGTDVAYALMVLAREGAANMGDLRYYADAKGGDFATPLAAAQLGAALAFYGDQTRADAMFTIAAQKLEAQTKDPETRVFRADYGTHLRDTAGVLTLAVESGSNAIDRSALAARIGASDRLLSTQESAWTLMAAKALIDDPSVAGLSVDGAEVQGPFVRTLSSQAITPVAIRNAGQGDTDITLTTIGVPSEPVPAGGYGYSIERAYYTMDGTLVEGGTVASGTRLVTVLTVTPFEKTGARLMINDALPAGLEIDNPNLLRSGDISQLKWLKPIQGEHSEFRADRFLTAVDWRSDKAFRLAYIVRAVAPGQYHHPAATVEDMYRPRYRARTDAGQLTVTE